MPVVLDPDAAAVYKAFQEAGRPAYETLTAPEARDYYMQARLVSNPEPPELQLGRAACNPRPSRHDPGAHLHAKDAAREGWPRAMSRVLPRRRLGDRQSRDTRRGLPQACA